MLQRLPIALAQVKAGNTYENLLNEMTSDTHRLLLNLIDRINLKRSDEYVVLPNLSVYYTKKILKTSYKNNKSKISTPTWNEEFE